MGKAGRASEGQQNTEKGEAMIYKRGGVYWYKFRWSVKGEDGTNDNYVIRKSARATNKKAAGEAEDEHKRALRLGSIHPADPWPAPKLQAPQVPTLREFTKQFLAYIEVQKKAGTKRFYQICSNRVLKFSPLADAVLTDVTGELIAKYAQWRRSTSESESVLTVNGELRTLRRMLRLAHEWGIAPQVPTIHELPGGKGRERVISFAEEVRYLSKASQTVKDAAMLAVDTGMRPDELFHLEWCDVHLQSIQDAPQGSLHVRQGKTDNAVRNIPLTPRTREMLLIRRELMVGPKGNKRVCGEQKYVFPGGGNSGHLVTVQHAHEKAARDAGLEAFEFYCWRHTFGTRCAESGMDKFSLARLMGHSSPRVAERYYIHVTEPHVMTGFERFSAYQTAGLVNAIKQQSDKVQ
jgi:integrase